MKINITKKQYQQLMDKCFIADWIINVYRGQPSEESAEHEELLQYLLSFAKDFDFEDNITFLKDQGIYEWTREFQEQNGAVRSLIAEYDYNRFSDILSDKLAEVALREKYTEEELEQMDPQALSEQFLQLKQQVRRQSTLMPDHLKPGGEDS